MHYIYAAKRGMRHDRRSSLCLDCSKFVAISYFITHYTASVTRLMSTMSDVSDDGELKSAKGNSDVCDNGEPKANLKRKIQSDVSDDEEPKAKLKSDASEYVKLNVGESLFRTTRGTLTKYDTMLQAMFSGEIGVETDSEGKLA